MADVDQLLTASGPEDVLQSRRNVVKSHLVPPVHTRARRTHWKIVKH